MLGRTGSEMKRDGACESTRRHVVSPAERGKEIVKHVGVRQVNDLELCAPAISIAVKQIIVPDRKIEQITRGDARRIVVVILGSRRGNLQLSRAVLGSRAGAIRTDAHGLRGVHASAEQAGFELLVRRKAGNVNHGVGSCRAVVAVASCAR